MSARAPRPLTVRLHADGTLDEVVCDNCSVHLEQMSDGCFWLGVTKGENSVNVWLNASGKGRVAAIYEPDGNVAEERS